LRKTRHPKKSSKSRRGSLNGLFGLENKSALFIEDKFLEYCQHGLLSDSAASDGLVSQNDATEFIPAVCGITDNEDVTHRPLLFHSTRQNKAHF
jgi:hypothetical protein